jgi:hypothetical protein
MHGYFSIFSLSGTPQQGYFILLRGEIVVASLYLSTYFTMGLRRAKREGCREN